MPVPAKTAQIKELWLAITAALMPVLMPVRCLMQALMPARSPLKQRVLATLAIYVGTLGKATPCATTAGEERHNEGETKDTYQHVIRYLGEGVM